LLSPFAGGICNFQFNLFVFFKSPRWGMPDEQRDIGELKKSAPWDSSGLPSVVTEVC
jgi:hypothetical protein